jgi:hypothetical protein
MANSAALPFDICHSSLTRQTRIARAIFTNPFLDSLPRGFIIRAPVGLFPFEIENEK